MKSFLKHGKRSKNELVRKKKRQVTDREAVIREFKVLIVKDN
jgi:hypothetical protein